MPAMMIYNGVDWDKFLGFKYIGRDKTENAHYSGDDFFISPDKNIVLHRSFWESSDEEDKRYKVGETLYIAQKFSTNSLENYIKLHKNVRQVKNELDTKYLFVTDFYTQFADDFRIRRLYDIPLYIRGYFDDDKIYGQVHGEVGKPKLKEEQIEALKLLFKKYKKVDSIFLVFANILDSGFPIVPENILTIQKEKSEAVKKIIIPKMRKLERMLLK